MSERRGVRLDPAVRAALGDGERRAARRVMTPGERRRQVRDDARCTATFDLQPEVLEGIRAAAAREDCSASSLVNALVREGLARLGRGEVVLRKRESRSPRFRWIVE